MRSDISLRSLTRENFKGWQAYALRQGPLVLRVVPDVGGRLMGIEYQGAELCFIHPQLQGQIFDGSASAWSALCTDWPFPLWGGGKTWIAPESDWPNAMPHRDLDSGAWQVQAAWCDDSGMGVALQSPICSQTSLQLQRRLSLASDASQWSVEHTITNRSKAPVRCGIWDVLMLRRPGQVYVPVPTGHEADWAALPGKPSVAQLQQAGVLKVQDRGVHIDCAQAQEFKLGLSSERGEMVVSLAAGNACYRRRSWVDGAQSYAHDRPLEVFNAPQLPYFEVETHSPWVTLGPGQDLSYVIEERVASVSEVAGLDFNF